MTVSTSGRVLRRLLREERLLRARVRYPSVRFGAGCDVRPGLRIRVVDGGDVSFGDRAVLDRALTVECRGRLRVGNNVIFGHHCTVAANLEVTIGDDCLLAEMVSVRDHDHRWDSLDVPIRDQGWRGAPVSIGKGAWLGAHVVVTSGVHIGQGAIIGAGAVVTRDIPALSIAVGVPAKVIASRGNAPVDGAP